MGAGTHKPFSAKDLKKVEEMVARGVTRASVAKWLGISRASFYRIMETDKALKKAVERGRDEDYQVMINCAREKALEGSYQHLNGYMRLTHQVNMSGDGEISRSGGAQITVNLNMFAENNELTGRVNKSNELIEGEYSED